MRNKPALHPETGRLCITQLLGALFTQTWY